MLRFPVELTIEWRVAEDAGRRRSGHVCGCVAPSGIERATLDVDALAPQSGGRRRRRDSEAIPLTVAEGRKQTDRRRHALGAPAITNLQASRAFRERCVAAGLLPPEPSAARALRKTTRDYVIVLEAGLAALTNHAIEAKPEAYLRAAPAVGVGKRGKGASFGTLVQIERQLSQLLGEETTT